MGEYVQADMSTLRAQYTNRKLHTLKEHAAVADKRLVEQRRRLLSEQRAAAHFARADVRLRAINEAKFDPQEAKQIAATVKRLQSLMSNIPQTPGQDGKPGGQLHTLNNIVKSISDELGQFSGAGWWKRMLASMKDSRNPMTKAAALEGLLKGGMEAMEDILATQGDQLKPDVVIMDQGPAGQNVLKAMARAFDPGRISALSSLGGGKISQLFGTQGSLGDVIAKDLSMLTPSQLSAFSKQVGAMETVAPQEVTPQAAAAAQTQSPDAQQAQPSQQAQASQQQAPAAARAPSAPATDTKDDVQLAMPDSESGQKAAEPAPEAAPESGKQPIASIDTKTLQSKAGSYLSNMKVTLNRNEPKKALLHAVRALKAIGVTDLDTAIKMLQPAAPAEPAKTG